MFPTVTAVLELASVRAGDPEVLAGAAALGQPVRWVQVSELTDLAPLLRGGELILATGVALPTDDHALQAYVLALNRVGAAGLVIKLGRRFQGRLPPSLVGAAERAGLPLIVLRRETRFAAIAEAVHAQIVDARLADLQTSEQVHQTFTELSVEGADPTDIVVQAARMSGRPVVLENMSHQILAYDSAGGDPAYLLVDWEHRSRSVEVETRTGVDAASGWLVTTVGARGDDWGRLVLVGGAQVTATDHLIVERASQALALGRLLDRDREALERSIHGTLLSGILTHSRPDSAAAIRAKALGVPIDGRRLVAVIIRPGGAQGASVLDSEQQLRDLADAAALAVRGCHLAALVGAINDDSVGVLISLAETDPVDTDLVRFVDALGRSTASPPMVAIGSAVAGLPALRRSFLEAAQVADAAAQEEPDRTGPRRRPRRRRLLPVVAGCTGGA